MFKFYEKYKVLKKLRNINDNFNEQEIAVSSEHWLKRTKRVIEFFDNDSKMRSLVTEILIKWRKVFPYEPQHREAKKMYEEYFQMENHIPSFESLNKGDYVVRFRSEAPVKGDRYAEYHINGGGFDDLRTYKLGKKNKKYNYFEFEVDSMGEGISDDFYTSFRYATYDEAKKHKRNLIDYKDLEKQIEKSNEFTAKLEKLKRNIL